MSRYRPPSAPKSAYITQQGAQILLDELKYLWKEKLDFLELARQ